MGWLHANLFSNWLNSLLTLIAIYFLVTTIPGLVEWLFVNSVWGDNPPEVCKAAQGACWSFIYEKYRFILFGRFPWDEQWRPLAAMVVFLLLIFGSCLKPVWRLGWWIAVGWLIGLVAVGTLMWGGVLGMERVDQSLWGGLPLTLFLATFGTVFAFPLGILFALGRRSNMPAIRALSVTYIELIRGVPLISILFMASVMFPLFLPQGVTVDKLLRAQVGIILFAAGPMPRRSCAAGCRRFRAVSTKPPTRSASPTGRRWAGSSCPRPSGSPFRPWSTASSQGSRTPRWS